jgi:homoserine kinase
LTISVPATSANLGPGFDTLGLAISLRNRVRIKPSRFNSVSLKGEGSKNPKLKDNNMFLNIFNDFYKNLTGRKDNFRFEFYNRVPLSRGLGSSSAVIISAIASAYEMAKVPASKEKILNLALAYEPHPDNITSAVMGGFNVSIVKNNRVTSIKKELPASLQAVVVIPNQPISTQQSRKGLPVKYSKGDAVFNISHSSLLTAAFFNEDWELLRSASEDCFHEEFRMKGLPELFEVRDVALNSGSLMSTLSGSGSTFFNLVYRNDAKRVKDTLQKNFPHYNILILDLDNDGLVIEA